MNSKRIVQDVLKQILANKSEQELQDLSALVSQDPRAVQSMILSAVACCCASHVTRTNRVVACDICVVVDRVFRGMQRLFTARSESCSAVINAAL